jgi:hypothetical protein
MPALFTGTALKEARNMRLSSLGISAAALGVVLIIGAGSVRAQETTESETTTTTGPVAPSVSSQTVTKKTVVNPPAVVVAPPPSTTSETTTTESADADAAPSVDEKTKTKTTYGPLGVTHSETSEKTSSY